MTAPKPIVPTGIMTEFGELRDDPAQLFAEMGMNQDVTYVPGFSDLRREADLARSEGKRPRDLPVNLRWVRRTLRNGMPTNERIVIMRGKNYRPVTTQDLKAKPDWLTEMPAHATTLPDGTIGSADMQLMVCDGVAARRNAARKLLRWMEFNTASAEEAIRVAGTKVKGSEAEVTRELGEPVLK